MKNSYHVVNEKLEIILPGQFYNVEICSICKNNLYSKKNVYPLTNLRITNVTKDLQKSYVVTDDLNFLGWVVLKSDMSLSEKFNIPLAKHCAKLKTVLGKIWLT